ncbi:hypothetical protein E4U26_003968 [Claviceps purpurea]|nr:hypothetical protein E4U26_003968 [Claviceps purpurea]
MPPDQKQARELVNVLQEAKQQIDPRLAEMARFGGGGGNRYGGWGRGRGGGGGGRGGLQSDFLYVYIGTGGYYCRTCMCRCNLPDEHDQEGVALGVEHGLLPLSYLEPAVL